MTTAEQRAFDARQAQAGAAKIEAMELASEGELARLRKANSLLLAALGASISALQLVERQGNAHSLVRNALRLATEAKEKAAA